MTRTAVGVLGLVLGLPLGAYGAGLPGEPFDIADPTPRPVHLGVDVIHWLLTDPADPFVCIDLNDPTAPPLGLGDPPAGPLPYGINVPLGDPTRPACRTAHNVHGFNAPPLFLPNDGRVVSAYDPQTGIPQGTIPLDGPGVTFAEEGSQLAALLDGGNLPGLWTGTQVVVEAPVFQAFISSGPGRDAIPDGHPLNELAWSDLVIAFDVGTGQASLQAQGTVCHGSVAPDADPTSATFGLDVCSVHVGRFWMVGESDGGPWDFFAAFGDPFSPFDVIVSEPGRVGVTYGHFFGSFPTDVFCAGTGVPPFGFGQDPCLDPLLLPGEVYHVSTNPLLGFPQGVLHAVTANLAEGFGILYDDLGDFALYEVPEPGSLALLAAGILGVLVLCRRRRGGRDLLVLVLALGSLSPRLAQAALIEVDLLAPGDGLVTRDTETALDWLDLTESVGLSFDDVEADVGGFVSAGWRHATGPEVCDLFQKIDVAPVPCPGGSALASATSYFNLLGVTFDDQFQVRVATGFYDDGASASDLVGYASIRTLVPGGGMVEVLDDLVPPDSPGNHFLVRPIPEPGAGSLALLGLAAVALMRGLQWVVGVA